MAIERVQFTCISCPIGCPLEIEHEDGRIIKISGNSCPRGAKYAEQEFTDPRRVFSTTVAIEGAAFNRLPVKLSAPMPKARLLEAAHAIHEVCAQAPVTQGQVIIKDLLGMEGIDVVAIRSMPHL